MIWTHLTLWIVHKRNSTSGQIHRATTALFQVKLQIHRNSWNGCVRQICCHRWFDVGWEMKICHKFRLVSHWHSHSSVLAHRKLHPDLTKQLRVQPAADVNLYLSRFFQDELCALMTVWLCWMYWKLMVDLWFSAGTSMCRGPTTFVYTELNPTEVCSLLAEIQVDRNLVLFTDVLLEGDKNIPRSTDSHAFHMPFGLLFVTLVYSNPI